MKPFRLLVTKKINGALREKAEAKGAEVIEKEFIGIELLSTKLDGLFSEQGNTIVFTSKNAVKAVGQSAKEIEHAAWKIFCLEGATLAACRNFFPDASVEATAADGAGLAEKIIKKNPSSGILFFCGDRRRDELPTLLKEHHLSFKEIVVYKTTLSPVHVNEEVDGIAFFSPSAVESFFSMNTIDSGVICFSIGNTTSAELKKYEASNIITLERPAEEELIKEVIKVINKH
jgi:uroporphyrinogen-III synthase